MTLSVFWSWVCLFIAIVFSALGTIFLKLSHGLSYVKPTVLLTIFYTIAFVAMTLALKHIDLSIMYGVWSGFGTALVATIGMVYFHESVSLKKIFYLLIIVVGVIGLQCSENF